MFNKLKKLIKNIILTRSKKVGQQIIVFESDDWGAVRNFNSDSINLIRGKYALDCDNYQMFDTLESNRDVELLRDVLLKNTNGHGEVPKFTLNYVMNNPDFDKTIKNGYKKLELIETLKLYQKNIKTNKIIDLVKSSTCFQPQFHGYIHFNNYKLSNSIKDGVSDIDRFAFAKHCIGFTREYYCGLDACNTFVNREEIECNLIEGLKQFKDVFGLVSKSVIFPCYVWDDGLESVCRQYGVKYLQGKINQNIPISKNKYKTKLNIMGKVSKSNLVYLNRNIDFEPSKFFLKNKSADECVNETMKQIEFLINKKIPVVICSHRVNYVSGIDTSCREFSHECLDKLLKTINEKYPEIIYLYSDELGEIYGNKILQKY